MRRWKFKNWEKSNAWNCSRFTERRTIPWAAVLLRQGSQQLLWRDGSPWNNRPCSRSIHPSCSPPLHTQPRTWGSYWIMVLIKIPMILRHHGNVYLNGSSSTLLPLYVLRKRMAIVYRQHVLKRGYHKGQSFGLLAVPEYVKILWVNFES